MPYFHVTPKENLGSILEHGLLPTIGGRSRQMGEPCPKIFLFPTMEDLECALMNWLGDQFEVDDELSILEIDLPADALLAEGEADYEVGCLSRIPPQNIEVICANDLDLGACKSEDCSQYPRPLEI